MKKLALKKKKAGLKLNIQKTKIMASSPITSWQIDGETMETVRVFTVAGSKITADGDCSHEIKRHLLLGRKAMTNLDSILKSRDINLPTKVQFSSVQLFSFVQFFVTPWTAARQASLSVTNFWSLLKLISIESVMPSNHLTLSPPSPPACTLSQHQGLFQRASFFASGGQSIGISASASVLPMNIQD